MIKKGKRNVITSIARSDTFVIAAVEECVENFGDVVSGIVTEKIDCPLISGLMITIFHGIILLTAGK